MNPLTPAERRALKARAHALKPVIIVSDAGLSAGVLAEIDRSLKRHELIKIKLAGRDWAQREGLFEEICARTGAHPVRHIGKTLVVYRETLEHPKPAPRPSRTPRDAGRGRSARS